MLWMRNRARVLSGKLANPNAKSRTIGKCPSNVSKSNSRKVLKPKHAVGNTEKLKSRKVP